jgi:2-polyprenyl-6-methoxyphenol hydroxylase-like FAD-dependent oxidoreductase
VAQGVQVTFNDAPPVTVDYLIGCDGGHSVVRKALGVGFAGEAPCVTGTGEPVGLFDLFRGPHHTLLGFGAGTAAAVRSIAATRPVPAYVIAPGADVVDASGHAAEAYGITGDTLVFVRPEGTSA